MGNKNTKFAEFKVKRARCTEKSTLPGHHTLMSCEDHEDQLTWSHVFVRKTRFAGFVPSVVNAWFLLCTSKT